MDLFFLIGVFASIVAFIIGITAYEIFNRYLIHKEKMAGVYKEE
jgi:hypothetical protein